MLYTGTAPSSLAQKVMREGGRAGAGLIYPRFEAHPLGEPAHGSFGGGSFLPSSPSREEGFASVERPCLEPSEATESLPLLAFRTAHKSHCRSDCRTTNGPEVGAVPGRSAGRGRAGVDTWLSRSIHGQQGQSGASMCRGGAYEEPRLFAAIDLPSSPQATQVGHSIF